MKLSNFSTKRNIFSYYSVQGIVGRIVRNRIILSKKKSKLLNVGCGQFFHHSFINLDRWWLPQIDVCWDINKIRYPFEDNTFEGIFTEHCLEHIPFEGCIKVLNEFFRILLPEGCLRIIVPDAELYLQLYVETKKDPSVKLPFSEQDLTPMASVNRIFRGYGHQYAYDFQTIERLLKQIGFRKIERVSFRAGKNPSLLIDQEFHMPESLYVEAFK